MHRLAFLLMTLVFGETLANAAPGVAVSRLEVLGVSRTDVNWVASYLGLTFPTHLDSDDLVAIRAKLMTTDVFQSVTVGIQPVDSGPGQKLVIDLAEKWTTIPVIRGAYGGGTPLAVLGAYNTHSFGRLWTLGAEAHRYGTSPPGAVMWARAPRWLQGKHVLGFELWREFRRRAIYDEARDPLGVINTNTAKVRALYMIPLGIDIGRDATNWQLGIDAESSQEAPVVFDPDPAQSRQVTPPGIRLANQPSTVSSLQATLVYDDITIEDVNLGGARFAAKLGPLIDGDTASTRYEGRGFYFFLWPNQWNLAVHGLVGGANTDALQAQYFLGGFDSIRGIPDGAIYGTRAAYTNIELRKVTAVFKYLKIQNAAFVDAGGAGPTWSEASTHGRVTAGVGVRLSIPQVYRLAFRIDYARNVDGHGGQGISAGLNQFFQPYKPL